MSVCGFSIAVSMISGSWSTSYRFLIAARLSSSLQDGLDADEFVEARLAAFAAEPADAIAAKRREMVVADAGIDPHCAGIQLRDKTGDTPVVARLDVIGEPVDGGVGEFDSLFLTVEWSHREYRPEDFSLSQFATRIDIGEDSWVHEVTVRQFNAGSLGPHE